MTLTAGAMTVANGVAEIQQGLTSTDEDPDGMNFMRDGICGGNTELYETQKAVYKTTAEAGTMVLNCYTAIHGPCCFVAGTLVLTEEGPERIEEVEAGDVVYASDPFTGEEGYRQVTRTFENVTDGLIHLTIDGKTVTTTETHPFYVAGKGWTEAARLRAGDILVTVNGERVILEQVSHEIAESPVTVYYFEVDDLHTYYVGTDGSDPDSFVLVHNSCGDIGTYNKLSKANKGSGNEVHHILEKRFLGLSKHDTTGQMQSIVLSKNEHRILTNLWRNQISYGSNPSVNDVISAIQIVYRDKPQLLQIALSELR